MRIAGVILAAGGSKRMGSAKQLLPFDGVSLIRRAATAAVDAGFDPVVVVVGADSEAVIAEVADLGVQVVVNERWETGIGSSIRTGAAAVASSKFDGVALMLSDQPLVTADSLRRLTSAFQESNSAVAASSYSETLGVPAVFGRPLLHRLMELPDESGAKPLIASMSGSTFAVEMPEAAADVDTEADYKRLVERDR